MFQLIVLLLSPRNRLLTGLMSLFCVLMISRISFSATKKNAVQKNFKDCISCHQGIEAISPNHAFACETCHLMPKYRDLSLLTDHQLILRNPSDPKTVRQFCLPCHEDEISNLAHSLHWSMAGIINQTRYLWGAQERANPARYGVTWPLTPLPEPDLSKPLNTSAALVDDFLRKRCLRCHLHTKGSDATGLYRAAGCAACHVQYSDDGLYRGKDKSISKSKPGYPAKHVFSRRIPNGQCLHCHHQNRVGADYEGLFAHDYSDTFRSPLIRGEARPQTHGLYFHHLSKDVHCERGLWCIDCHTQKEIMGDGQTYSYQLEVPKRSCEDCHGGFDKRFPDSSISAILKTADGFCFLSKNGKEKHPLPLFDGSSAAHRITNHRNVRCSACHAQWSYQDYGLSVMREEVIQDYKWADKTVQGDPALQNELKLHSDKDMVGYPASKDWLSGEKSQGIWSLGWRFRRWEPMPLGVDQTGRFAILRPRYQYLISAVDRNGLVLLDSEVPLRGDGSGKGWAFMPYVPHTTAPFGRACLSCHRNGVAAGLPLNMKPTVDTLLMIPSSPAIKTMRLLNKKEQKKLLEPGTGWHKERLRHHRSSQ